MEDAAEGARSSSKARAALLLGSSAVVLAGVALALAWPSGTGPASGAPARARRSRWDLEVFARWPELAQQLAERARARLHARGARAPRPPWWDGVRHDVWDRCGVGTTWDLRTAVNTPGEPEVHVRSRFLFDGFSGGSPRFADLLHASWFAETGEYEDLRRACSSPDPLHAYVLVGGSLLPDEPVWSSRRVNLPCVTDRPGYELDPLPEEWVVAEEERTVDVPAGRFAASYLRLRMPELEVELWYDARSPSVYRAKVVSTVSSLTQQVIVELAATAAAAAPAVAAKGPLRSERPGVTSGAELRAQDIMSRVERAVVLACELLARHRFAPDAPRRELAPGVDVLHVRLRRTGEELVVALQTSVVEGQGGGAAPMIRFEVRPESGAGWSIPSEQPLRPLDPGCVLADGAADTGDGLQRTLFSARARLRSFPREVTVEVWHRPDRRVPLRAVLWGPDGRALAEWQRLER